MKISVAIPTVAGRQQYLPAALATCTSQPHDFEIIVSDNSPGDAEAVVAAANDPRVRYIRPPQFLTMAAHWDFVLANVTGDAVGIIGDDDGLMPGCIGALEAIYSAHGNIPVRPRLCNYFWPDHPAVAKRNTVTFFHDPESKGRWSDSEAYLRDAATGRLRYVDGPMIYHGFVPMPLLRQIAGTGPFFRRAIPDVYSAFAIAANTSRFWSAGDFLTIAGQGARSNGALVNTGGSDGSTFSVAAAPAIHTPRFASRGVALLAVDSLLETASQFGRPELAAAIDFPYFLEAAFVEASQMGGIAAKRREFGEVAAIARDRGLGVPIIGRIGRRVAAKLGRLAGVHSPHAGRGPRPMLADIGLDPTVIDIAGAARAVADYLGTHKAAARGAG